MRSCESDPLGTDIVHVREDCRYGADLARRLGSPGGRVKIFDKNLVQPIVDSKDLDGGSAEFCVRLFLARGHGYLGPILLPVRPAETFLLSESKTGDIIVHRFGLERGKHLY